MAVPERVYCKVRSQAQGRRLFHVFRCSPSTVTCIWCELQLIG